MLILKENAANSVPTPPVGKDTFFIDDSGTPSVKNATGNVTTFPVVNASNAQVVFMDGSSLSGEAAFTYDFNNNVLNVTGNISATNIKTDNLLYANGSPWDLQQPGGSNTQIQFNDADQFGGSAAFTFNKSSNLVSMGGALSVTGNANVGNLGTAQVLATANVTAPQLVSNVSTGTAPLVVSSTTRVANLDVAKAGIANTVNDAAQPNITSVGTLTSLSVTGTASAGNLSTGGNLSVSGNAVISGNLTVDGTLVYVNVDTLAVEDPIINLQTGPNGAAPVANSGKDVGSALNYYDSQARIAFMGWDVSNAEFGLASQASISSEVVTFSTYGNLRAGVYFGNAAGLTNIPGGNIVGNISGNISNATHAVTANTVVDAAQPNITSVGTLTSLAVTGNANVGNLGTGGLITATGNVSGGNLTTAGVVAATGNVSGGNLTTAGALSVTGNANVGNLGTAGLITATGNITGGNLVTAGILSVTGNANVGNLGATAGIFTGNISSLNANLGNLVTANVANLVDLNVSGNANIGGGSGGNISGANVITANTFVGNLQGQVANGNSNVSIPAANGNVNISAVGTANVIVVTGTGVNVSGTLNATGNANVGNLGTAGLITATGNVTGGNINTAGKVVASTLESNVSTGTAPFIVASTTKVANLNADLLDGFSTATAATANTVVIRDADGSFSANVVTATLSGAATTAGTVTTNAQPNITSVGTLSSLAVTGNATAGNVYANSGTIGASLLTGTLTTAAQPNITSLGVLTGLGVNGNITAANITANTGVFTGNGSGLSALAGANVTGQVANAAVAGTVYTNAQPNITSVGTLSSLAVTGNATAGNVYANSGTIGASLLAGTLTTAAQPNITSVGTLSSLSITGNIAAGNLTTTGVLSVTGTGVSSIAGNLDMTSNNIINLAAPVNSTDAATKQYVDDIAQGLHVHAPSAAATPDTLANISGGTVTYNNGSSGVGATLTTTGTYTTIDTVNIASVGTRILVKNEANAAHNGIYTYTSSTVLTRATDFDTPTEMAGGDFTFVSGGATYNDTGWVMTDPVTTVGTTNVVFVQFSGAGTYTAGTGLTLTGSVFSVNASQTQVTSVGTLTGLNVNGNITAANITANTGVFTGNGSGLSALAGGNVTGQVANALVAGTVYTNAQPNITSLGTLTSLSVTGNVSAGNVSGTLLTGTLATAAQPNVTSLGTLTGLGVNGTITGVNITANTGVFTGNGSGLSALAGANVTGQVANAAVAGTVYTAAQPNITSTGTLTSLAVTGNISAGNVSATTFTGALSGAATSATTAGTVTTAAQPNITSLGTLTSLGVNGTVTAVAFTANTGVFTGNGSGLSAIAGANVTGTVSSATTAGTVTTAAQPNITSVGTLTSLSSSGNIVAPNVQANTGFFISSINAAVSAAGTAQGNATALTREINVTSTVASGAGVALPTAVAGMRVTIINTAANAVLVYPASGGTINSLALNAAFSQAAGARLDFIATTGTQWYTLNATYL